ncbi:hypothetical protein FQN54_001532 [Arachnomyces sp. PD_36]|nr:hypothetical protein FQN54_001532 [Arachnomyces sp. PD_36]
MSDWDKASTFLSAVQMVFSISTLPPIKKKVWGEDGLYGLVAKKLSLWLRPGSMGPGAEEVEEGRGGIPELALDIPNRLSVDGIGDRGGQGGFMEGVYPQTWAGEGPSGQKGSVARMTLPTPQPGSGRLARNGINEPIEAQPPLRAPPNPSKEPHSPMNESIPAFTPSGNSGGGSTPEAVQDQIDDSLVATGSGGVRPTERDSEDRSKDKNQPRITYDKPKRSPGDRIRDATSRFKPKGWGRNKGGRD